MFGCPQHHHALQQAGARPAAAGKQVGVGSCGRRWRLIRHVDAVLGCSDFDEAHLAADVVQCADEQVEGAVQGMELGVLHLRQADLGDERADKLHVAAGVVSILHHPLLERAGREGAASRMREEGLLGGVVEEVLVGAEEVRCQGRREGARAAGRLARSADGRDGLALASALVLVWPAAMDLEVRVRRMAVQDGAGGRGGDGVAIHAGRLSGVGVHVGLRFGGVEVLLALLEMLDLAGCVLGSD